MRKIILAYMPVLHQGYINFLRQHSDADSFYIFGPDVIDDFGWLKRKDIRAVDPELMRLSVEALAIVKRVTLLTKESAQDPYFQSAELVFADEEESRLVASELFGESSCVRFENVFLRWDKPRVLDTQNADGFVVTQNELHRRMMGRAFEVAEKSSDWWIHVGAVLVQGDKIIVAYNRHLPSDYAPYVFGDPRSLFNKGVNVELTTALHSEAAVIGRAAREGISTSGARLYVTTFPCPYCANVLSESGISELYFSSGYSMLEGEQLLRRKGIQIFRVE